MARHDVIVTLTGESTGIQKAAKSGALAMQGLATAIQSVVEKTQSSSTAVNQYRDGLGKYTNATVHAKAAVAQLNQEEAKRIAIENQLIATLTKEEVAVLRKNGIIRQQVAVIQSATSATSRFDTAVKQASASTSIWNSRLQAFRVTGGQTVSVLQSARAAVAQLESENKKAIQVEQMLVNALSAEQVVLLRNAGLMTSLTVVTNQHTGAVARGNTAMMGTTGAAGSAQFAVLGLTQGIQDAGNFGMGMAQGIRAVNNNVQQFATALTFASAQAGGLGLAMKGMWTAIKGPAGILLAFSAISASIEYFSNASQRANKDIKEVKDGLTELFSVKTLDGIEVSALGLIDVADASDRIADKFDNAKASIKSTISASIAATAAVGTAYEGMMNVGIATTQFYRNNDMAAVEGGIKALEDTASKWRDLSEVQREAAESARLLEEASRDIADEMGVDKLAAAISKQAASVSEYVRITKKASAVAESGLGSESAFDKGFKSFSESLIAVNSDLKITEAEFAKLNKQGETATKLAEEWEKGSGKWATSFTDGIESAKDTVGQLEENLKRLQGPEGERLVALELQAEALEKQVQHVKDLIKFDFSGLPMFIEKVDAIGPVIMPKSDKPVVKSAGEVAGVPQKLNVPSGLSNFIADHKLGEKVETDADRAVKALNKLNNAFENVAAQGITSVIDGLASLATGQEKSFAVGLILPFADMAIQLGKIAIATGIGLTGIKKAFEFPLHPGAAIAAGVALVTLGSVVKSQIKKTGSSIGAGSSGGSGGAGSSRGGGAVSFGAFSGVTSVASLPSGAGLGLTTGYQPPTLTDYRFEIRGRDLVSVLDMEGGARTRMGARN